MTVIIIWDWKYCAGLIHKERRKIKELGVRRMWSPTPLRL